MAAKQLLTPGSIAPEFKATLWNGNSFDSSKLRGSKVWLAFFRYASCPLCNLRVHEMITKYDTLQKLGISIVAVFQSPAESIAGYVGKQNPPFPLIADPDEVLYELYGVGSSRAAFIHPGNLPKFAEAIKEGFIPGKPEGTLTRIPSDYLINEKGILTQVYHGGKIADHIPFDDVMRFAMNDK